MHKLAVIATVAMLGSVALGQASYTSFPVLTANGVAVAGANVALCSSLPTATTPCGGSSVLQTYSDITLATACTLNPLILGPTYGIGCTNPGLADGFGMVRLYISSSSGSPAGYVYYQAYGQGILVTDVEPLMFPGTGTGGGILVVPILKSNSMS